MDVSLAYWMDGWMKDGWMNEIIHYKTLPQTPNKTYCITSIISA
jgi:hypothetical protein